MKKSRLLGAVCAFTLSFCHSISASVITLPEYNGMEHESGFPIAAVTIGTFNVPTNIDSATISGTFGNSLTTATAGVDLFLDNILVGRCVKDTPCWAGGGPVTPWSYMLNSGELSIFDDGQAVLTAVQTSETFIRLGETELNFNTVPIPAAAWLFGSGLLGLVGMARCKKAA
jgi:hypothetical protein